MTTKDNAECPHCGQPMLMRYGVRMPPKKARLFDMIQNVTKGRGGVELDTLAWVEYPGVSRKTARDRIKSHICQINDLLCSTDVQIVNRYGPYQISTASSDNA